MSKTVEFHFRIVCFNCGKINHGDVPLASKEGMSAQCTRCNRIIIEFHQAEGT